MLELSSEVDNSSQSIGRRYARTDEIGIPFAITVDFQTLDDSSVTLREEDSMAQIRAPIAEIPDVVRQLIAGQTTFVEVQARYPSFTTDESN